MRKALSVAYSLALTSCENGCTNCAYRQKTVRQGAWMLFEWDENKRKANLAKHHIDFRDAKQVFEGPVFEKVDSRRGEDRKFAIGLMEGIEIVVVYVMRGERRRIISARRANRDERQDYQSHLEAAGKRPE